MKVFGVNLIKKSSLSATSAANAYRIHFNKFLKEGLLFSKLCIMLNVNCSEFMNVVSKGSVLLNTLLDVHFNLHCLLYVSVFIIV
jgi:hypothetical protein